MKLIIEKQRYRVVFNVGSDQKSIWIEAKNKNEALKHIKYIYPYAISITIY
jgi:hypothetical protein